MLFESEAVFAALTLTAISLGSSLLGWDIYRPIKRLLDSPAGEGDVADALEVSGAVPVSTSDQWTVPRRDGG